MASISQRNILDEIHNEWVRLQKSKRLHFENKSELNFVDTLNEKQKLMYTNLKLEYEYSVHFKEIELIHMVLKYISDLCNPRNDIFFD